MASKAAIEAAAPIFQKIYLEQSPVRPASLSEYPQNESLPGQSFEAKFHPHSISFDSNGTLLLAPGDYTIPVMTYCMDAGGLSPSSAVYTLSEFQGSRAALIQKLNQKALSQFSPSDVQTLSWSLQAGLSYEELGARSQRVFDAVLPDERSEIQESSFKKLGLEWDRISRKTNGLFPAFDEVSDDLLDQMGEVGLKVRALRELRSNLQQHGDDYARLSRMIDVSKAVLQPSQSTPWSKISDQIYARFITNGHFQEIGQIQIRVTGAQGRGPSALGSQRIPVNISSWIANPKDSRIQPLSFSMIVGSDGILLIPEIADAPVIAAALLGSVLSADVIDWDLYRQLKNFLPKMKDSQVDELIHYGNTALNKAYDDLERPLKDSGVIDKATKKTPEHPDRNTREYTKAGGVQELERDFDKLPGELETASDGSSIKRLPDGKKAVKRLESEGDQSPTLEMQPQKTGIKGNERLRVKVRYKS